MEGVSSCFLKSLPFWRIDFWERMEDIPILDGINNFLHVAEVCFGLFWVGLVIIQMLSNQSL